MNLYEDELVEGEFKADEVSIDVSVFYKFGADGFFEHVVGEVEVEQGFVGSESFGKLHAFVSGLTLVGEVVVGQI